MRAGNGSMFYTYVLRSSIDHNLYIGWTKDLKSRLQEHNNKKVQATKFRAPLFLIYYEACLSEEKAIAREKQLKTGFGRQYLKNRI
jgi:putative endonuclease